MQNQRLGPYEIGRKIGRGGMGTVYEGMHTKTGQPAAIKVLSTVLAHEEGFRDRFQAEIDSLRKLRHPNIVRIHGFGQQDDVLFYSMELVDGRSLEEELESGRRFTWRETTEIGVQICRALKHAHDRGVIHRDLKPGNLLLTDDGLLKLSDFGIAKLFGHAGQTAAGGVLGTAEYMAPEQADGRPVSDRADLYSLGGVLYALLARRAPFRAKTLPEMLQLQRYAEADPVRRYAPDTPAELESIIAQLLQKDPQQRLPTALVVMRRLEAMHRALSVGLESELPGDETPDPFIATSPTVTAIDALNEMPRRDVPDEPLREHALDKDPAAVQTAAKPPDDADDGASVDSNSSADGIANDVAVNAGQQEPDNAPVVEVRKARFTTVVDDDHAGVPPVHSASGPIVSIHTALLVLALLCVGWGVWWFLQPPDPDALYARVVAAAQEDLQELARVEDDLSYLLDQHHTAASDPRRIELLGYQERIELQRLDRRLWRRARRSAQDGSLLPVERAYIEAVRLLEHDGPEGVDRLNSVIRLYEPGSDASATTRRCLELARRQLRQHEAEAAQIIEDDLAALDTRLQLAQRLSAADPEKARQMWQAVVELYGDKPWAAAAVARAQDALAGVAQSDAANERR